MSAGPTVDDALVAGVADLVRDFDLAGLAANGLVAVHAGAAVGDVTGESRARLALHLLLGARHRAAAIDALTTVVAASDQPVVILKGLEIAERYPDPEQRQFSDIDLLVRSPERFVEDLEAIGYHPLPDIVPEGHHHLPPMRVDGSEFLVEVHLRPGWLHWMSPPTVDELFDRIVPAETPIAGLWTLDPIDHCLFVAVHAWADGAFRRGRDVLDIAVMRADLDPAELVRRADEWGLGRLWRTTQRCVDALLLDGPSSVTTRLLTGHIVKGRTRGPVSHRLAVYLTDFLVTSPVKGLRSAVHKLRHSDVVAAVAT